MNCPKCGNIIGEGITSCPICGEPVNNMTMPQNVAQPVPNVPPMQPNTTEVANTTPVTQTPMPSPTIPTQETPVAPATAPVQNPMAQPMATPATQAPTATPVTPVAPVEQPTVAAQVEVPNAPVSQPQAMPEQGFGMPSPTPMSEMSNITPDSKIDPKASKIKDQKNLSIIIIVAVILALAVGTYVVTRPHKTSSTSSSTNNTTTNTNTDKKDEDKKDDKKDENKDNNSEIGTKLVFDNKDEYGNIYFILNNSKAATENIDVTITLLDANNSKLDEEKVANIFVSANSYIGQTVLIDTSIEYTSYKIDVTKSANPNNYKDYAPSTAYTVEEQDGDLVAKWTNNTGVTLEMDAVLIYYKGGQIIGFESERINYLSNESESTITFQTPYGSKYKSLEYDSYKLFINAREY